MSIRMMSMIAMTALLATSAGSSAQVVTSGPYVGAGAPIGIPGGCTSESMDLHVGTACFFAPAGAERVWVKIQDGATDTPGGTLSFKSQSGTTLSPQVHFCTDTLRYDIPSGTARIEIDFWGPLDTQDPTCIATSGTIQVDFT